VLSGKEKIEFRRISSTSIKETSDEALQRNVESEFWSSFSAESTSVRDQLEMLRFSLDVIALN
jgi:hypothetical protein